MIVKWHTKCIKVKRGITRGHVVSQTFYGSQIFTCFQAVRVRVRHQRNLAHLLFADDLVLITDNLGEIERWD